MNWHLPAFSKEKGFLYKCIQDNLFDLSRLEVSVNFDGGAKSTTHLVCFSNCRQKRKGEDFISFPLLLNLTCSFWSNHPNKKLSCLPKPAFRKLNVWMLCSILFSKYLRITIISCCFSALLQLYFESSIFWL